MELTTAIKQQLEALIASPETVTQAHAPMLTNLIDAYPYHQPLHLLLAKANVNLQNNHLATAALYNNGNLLHNVLFTPQQLNKKTFNIIGFLPKLAIETLLDDQETFDEIVELDIAHYTPNKPEITEKEQLVTEPLDPTDLIIDSIASSDFFAFEQNFNNESIDEEKTTHLQEPVIKTKLPPAAENITVTKYDDEQLPYSFLWWLSKTRKQHQETFQPYANPKNNTQTRTYESGELQQQYLENIFHLQSPDSFTETVGEIEITEPSMVKGEKIIESFIKNAPQIKPLNPEQINNENKAKKSAEDKNDLVSETLASIYIEQMLFHKAIHTYQKLSLKFPEKSRYFADLIQSLEKKI